MSPSDLPSGDGRKGFEQIAGLDEPARALRCGRGRLQFDAPDAVVGRIEHHDLGAARVDDAACRRSTESGRSTRARRYDGADRSRRARTNRCCRCLRDRRGRRRARRATSATRDCRRRRGPAARTCRCRSRRPKAARRFRRDSASSARGRWRCVRCSVAPSAATANDIAWPTFSARTGPPLAGTAKALVSLMNGDAGVRSEEDLAAVARPAANIERFGAEKCQPPRRSADRRHVEDLGMPFIATDEGDRRPVRREPWQRAFAGTGGQAAGDVRRRVDAVQISSSLNKDDQFACDVRGAVVSRRSLAFGHWRCVRGVPPPAGDISPLERSVAE